MSAQHEPAPELPGLGPETGRGKARRVERAVVDATAAAQLTTTDAAVAALAVELGRAVDVASVRNDPYGVATAARELRETLIRLKLDPASREGAADDFAKWLDSLDDDADPAVSHPENP